MTTFQIANLEKSFKDQTLRLSIRINELEAQSKPHSSDQFDLSLTNIGPARSKLVKILRDETEIAFYEANQRILHSPEPILKNAERSVASRLRERMEMEGATVVIDLASEATG